MSLIVFFSWSFSSLNYWTADPGGCGPATARFLGLWVRIPPRAWIYFCLVSVVCCQVEVSATSWSPVQGSPNECDVSESDRKASTMRRLCLTRGCWTPWGGGAGDSELIRCYSLDYRGSIWGSNRNVYILGEDHVGSVENTKLLLNCVLTF